MPIAIIRDGVIGAAPSAAAGKAGRTVKLSAHPEETTAAQPAAAKPVAEMVVPAIPSGAGGLRARSLAKAALAINGRRLAALTVVA